MSCMSRGLSTEKEISEKYGTHGTFGHIFLSPSHLACENIRFFLFLVSSFTCREKRFGGRQAQAAKAQYESTYGCQEPINRLLRLRNFQNGRHYKKFAWELRYSQEFSIKYALRKLLGVIPVWLFSRFRRFHLSRVYRKFMRVLIFSNLLPEFPYKSVIMTAILKITIDSLFRQAHPRRPRGR